MSSNETTLLYDPHANVNWSAEHHLIQLHTHTTHAPTGGHGGSDPPHLVIDDYNSAGYSGLCLTEHSYNVSEPTHPWDELTSLEGGENFENRNADDLGMVDIMGCELEVGEQGTHILSIFNSTVDDNLSSIDDALSTIESDAGFAIFAHPGRFTGDDPSATSDYIGYFETHPTATGVEIWNATNRHPNDEDHWDNILNEMDLGAAGIDGASRHLPPFAYAGDDWHGSGNGYIFHGGMMVLPAQSVSTQNIRTGLEEGGCYAVHRSSETYDTSTLPYIDSAIVDRDAGTLTVESSQATHIALIVDASQVEEVAGTSATFDWQSLIDEGTISDGSYARVRTRHDDGRYGTTQPYLFGTGEIQDGSGPGDGGGGGGDQTEWDGPLSGTTDEQGVVGFSVPDGTFNLEAEHSDTDEVLQDQVTVNGSAETTMTFSDNIGTAPPSDDDGGSGGPGGGGGTGTTIDPDPNYPYGFEGDDSWELVVADFFDQGSFENNPHWNYHFGWGQYPGAQGFEMTREENVWIENEQLVLQLDWDESNYSMPSSGGDDYGWYSGTVNNAGLYDQEYGYWEACLNPLNADQMSGNYPAFWGESIPPDNWELEFDYVEYFTNPQATTHHTHYNSGGSEFGGPVDHGYDIVNEFHVIGFLWEPGRIAWYVNGEEVMSTTEGAGTGVGQFDHGHQIYSQFSCHINNVDWAGGDPRDNEYPMEWYVDWFRQWQNPEF